MVLLYSKFEYVDLPLALIRHFRLYCVTASTFKTAGSDRMRSERSSSRIWPKREGAQQSDSLTEREREAGVGMEGVTHL